MPLSAALSTSDGGEACRRASPAVTSRLSPPAHVVVWVMAGRTVIGLNAGQGAARWRPKCAQVRPEPAGRRSPDRQAHPARSRRSLRPVVTRTQGSTRRPAALERPRSRLMGRSTGHGRHRVPAQRRSAALRPPITCPPALRSAIDQPPTAVPSGPRSARHRLVTGRRRSAQGPPAPTPATPLSSRAPCGGADPWPRIRFDGFRTLVSDWDSEIENWAGA